MSRWTLSALTCLGAWSGCILETHHPTRSQLCDTPPPITHGIFSPCRVDPVPHDAPKPPGYTRFVCVSDTHSRTDPIQMPYGDVLIHAGDFTELGLPSEVKKFNEWLGK